ncbi:MAG: class E sortase [Oryzihumus sp.]
MSGLALWAVLYPVLVGGLQEQAQQQRLFAELRSQLSKATAPLAPTSYGRPVALLDIPAAGLKGAVVVEGTGGRDLEAGPGHRRDTVLPGQVGTSVVLGRSVAFGGPFGNLPSLRPGDRIVATTGQGSFTYVVDGLRRPGDLLPTPLAAGKGRLVLGTSEGSGWRSGFAPSSVLYVDATLQGKAQPVGGPLGAPVPASERPMGTSTAPLLGLVLWLEALVAAVVGGIWLRARGGLWQAWLVAVPLLVAVGVGASGVAAQLLPNLL